MFRVASASEYLVIKIAKKAWLLPGQSYSIFDISLVSYTFEVKAMSVEKLPFILLEREAEVAKANAEVAMKKAKWAKDSQLAVVEANKTMALLEAYSCSEGILLKFTSTNFNQLKSIYLMENDKTCETMTLVSRIKMASTLASFCIRWRNSTIQKELVNIAILLS